MLVGCWMIRNLGKLKELAVSVFFGVGFVAWVVVLVGFVGLVISLVHLLYEFPAR